jgi:hypothetical protein
MQLQKVKSILLSLVPLFSTASLIALSVVTMPLVTSQPASAESSDPSCPTQAGYPLGRWEIGSIKSTTPTSAFSTFITFTRPKGGTWLPASGQGSFTASSSPAPGEQVILRYRVDGNNTYSSKNKLVVSPDGCRMNGTFLDTEGHRGEVRYTWKGE